MTVAGIYSSFGTSAEVGIVASFADGRRGLMTHVNPSILYVNLTSLAHEAHVRTTIDQLFVEAYLSQFQDESVPQFSGSPHFVSGSQLKKEARRELASYVGLVFGILLIAVVIGSLGLANTISASVLQRYREIGMLHAIGATPQDVARMIVLEAVVLLSAAFALAVTLGSILATIVVRSASASLGFAVEYVYPWIWLPALAGGTFLIVLTAAMFPARRASRITPIEALRHD